MAARLLAGFIDLTGADELILITGAVVGARGGPEASGP